MFTHVLAAVLEGLQAQIITIEATAARGRPRFTIIGLASKVVAESKERVLAAIKSCDIRLKPRKTLVNLTPTHIKKTGAELDLAIAVGLLSNAEQMGFTPEKTLFLGELSLTGQVKQVVGALPLVLHAKEAGITAICISAENASELQVIADTIAIYPISHLRELITITELDQLSRLQPAQKEHTTARHTANTQQQTEFFDFRDIVGQELLKRALEIAAAGGHSILMVGPPGSGKTTAARATIGILPPPTIQEKTEIMARHSAAQLLSQVQQKQHILRPFRSPSHTASISELIGNTLKNPIGECLLAHGGILFLDECGEFPQKVLNALRQPLAERVIPHVNFSREKYHSSHWLLIAATNPCPCGFRSSEKKVCSCTEQARTRYQQRLSGPLLDRIDMHFYVDQTTITHEQQQGSENREGSAEIRARVARAHDIQYKRQHCLNTQLTSSVLLKVIAIEPTAHQLLTAAARKFNLSNRTYYKMLALARTIADLDGAPTINNNHIAEALQYRTQL